MQTEPNRTEKTSPKRKTEMPKVSIETIVDDLGKVKAKLAKLAVIEKQLVDALKAQGAAVYQGETFEANVFDSSKSSVDIKTLVTDYPKLAPIISKYTKTTPMLVCKVQAKVQR